MQSGDCCMYVVTVRGEVRFVWYVGCCVSVEERFCCVVNDSGKYILSFIDNTITQYICTRVHNVKHSIGKS